MVERCQTTETDDIFTLIYKKIQQQRSITDKKIQNNFHNKAKLTKKNQIFWQADI